MKSADQDPQYFPNIGILQITLIIIGEKYCILNIQYIKG